LLGKRLELEKEKCQEAQPNQKKRKKNIPSLTRTPSGAATAAYCKMSRDSEKKRKSRSEGAQRS